MKIKRFFVDPLCFDDLNPSESVFVNSDGVVLLPGPVSVHGKYFFYVRTALHDEECAVQLVFEHPTEGALVRHLGTSDNEFAAKQWVRAANEFAELKGKKL